MANFYRPVVGSPLIFVTLDRFGQRVLLEKDRFDTHIALHSEMIGNEGVIKESIENPTIILQSKQFPETWIYYIDNVISTHPLLSVVKTVVNHADTGSGFVTTSFLKKSINVQMEGERVIYDKETDKN